MFAHPLAAIAVCAALFAPFAAARPVTTIPPRQEVVDLLRREPITVVTWPAWRERLLAWIGDRSQSTDPAYNAARQFVRKQADAREDLTGPLQRDAFAWYMLGRSLEDDMRSGPGLAGAAAKAERAFRRSVALDPTFARAHRNLALVLLVQPAKMAEGERELAEARRLDPTLPLGGVRGHAALISGNYAAAEAGFREALSEEPDQVEYARALAAAIVQNRNRGEYVAGVRPLVNQFPNDGILACLAAMAYAFDNNARAAHFEIERARTLGTDPEEALSKQAVAAITEAGAPPWYETVGRRLGWWLLGFAATYAVAMLLMAGAGVVLASRTRGARALDLLGPEEGELVTAGGQVRRAGGETTLAKIYVAALAAGLILFYAAVPFVVAGLIGATAFLLWLIFQANRIPIKLVVLIVVVGGGAAWAVLKSLFARPAAGGFGLLKTAAECPKLHAAVAEVAGRVDTDPVNEIYVGPGASIGVQQEGRGPFGCSASRSGCSRSACPRCTT
jgi:Flp pilus assembly protein TadD